MNQLIYTPGMTLDQVEKVVILQALKFFQNNKTQTAKSLGIVYRTLDDKLKKYKDEDDAAKSRMEDQKKKAFAEQRRSLGEVVPQETLESVDCNLMSPNGSGALIKPHTTPKKTKETEAKK